MYMILACRINCTIFDVANNDNKKIKVLLCGLEKEKEKEITEN